MVGGPVGHHQFDGLQHRHPPLRGAVQFVADEPLEQFDLVSAVGLRDTNELAEVADGCGRVSAAAKCAQGGQARVVPAVDDAIVDQLAQLAFGGDCVRQFQPGEFGLAGLVAGQRQVVQVPVVQRPMTIELKRAQAVRDALDGVTLAVRPVVRGVQHPLVAGAVMRLVTNAIHDRIAQLHVVVLHVGLGAQHMRAVGKLAGAHAPEQHQVLVDRAVAVWALDARFAVAASLCGDGFGVLVVHVREAGADQMLGPLVELLEVVAGVDRLARLEAQPANVVDDRVDVFGLLGDGVGVVEAQLAQPAELVGDAKVDADCLGVPDVEIAVGFGREPGLHTTAECTLLDVGAHLIAHEVGGGGSVRCVAHRAGTVSDQPRRRPDRFVCCVVSEGGRQ